MVGQANLVLATRAQHWVCRHERQVLPSHLFENHFCFSCLSLGGKKETPKNLKIPHCQGPPSCFQLPPRQLSLEKDSSLEFKMHLACLLRAKKNNDLSTVRTPRCTSYPVDKIYFIVLHTIPLPLLNEEPCLLLEIKWVWIYLFFLHCTECKRHMTPLALD